MLPSSSGDPAVAVRERPRVTYSGLHETEDLEQVTEEVIVQYDNDCHETTRCMGCLRSL